jgi:hypothetical protein
MSEFRERFGLDYLKKSASVYVYQSSEPGLFTVGFYDPSGKWHPESDHSSIDEASKRVHYLNGGN